MNDLLLKQEAAELLQCSEETIESMARNQELPAVKFGRGWIFHRGTLMQTIADMSLQNLKRQPAATPKAVVMAAPRIRRAPPALPAV